MYALRRKAIVENGLDIDISSLQGYSSFVTESNYVTVGSNSVNEQNAILLSFALICLASFMVVILVLLLKDQYPTLYDIANDNQSNAKFVIWGVIILVSVTTPFIFCFDFVYIIVNRIFEPVPYAWGYYLTIVFGFIFLVVDLTLAIRFHISLQKEKRKFPIPDILNTIFFCNKYVLRIIQIIATWLLFVSAQLLPHHMVYIFLAFVASPIRTLSTFLLYIACAFSGVMIVALMLAMFQPPPPNPQEEEAAENIKQPTWNEMRRDWRYIRYRSRHLILFSCLLVFTLFFLLVFVRVTIYVGDVNSGGLPDLFASIAPSIFLAGMGFAGKKMLDRKFFLNTLPGGIFKPKPLNEQNKQLQEEHA